MPPSTPTLRLCLRQHEGSCSASPHVPEALGKLAGVVAWPPPLPVILWGTVSPDLEVSAKQKGFLTGPHSPTAPDGRLKAKGF